MALQYCVGICRTSTWIGHRCTYVPALLNPAVTLNPTDARKHMLALRHIRSVCFQNKVYRSPSCVHHHPVTPADCWPQAGIWALFITLCSGVPTAPLSSCTEAAIKLRNSLSPPSSSPPRHSGSETTRSRQAHLSPCPSMRRQGGTALGTAPPWLLLKRPMRPAFTVFSEAQILIAWATGKMLAPGLRPLAAFLDCGWPHRSFLRPAPAV